MYTPKTFPDKVGLIFSIKLTNLHRSNFFQKSIRLEDQLPLLDHTSAVTVVQFLFDNWSICGRPGSEENEWNIFTLIAEASLSLAFRKWVTQCQLLIVKS